MSNARDDKDWFEYNPEKKHKSESVFSPSEEIGQMHFSTENYTTALEYFRKSLGSSDLKDYPDRFRLTLSLSDCYRQKGNYRDAGKYLDRAKTSLQ